MHLLFVIFPGMTQLDFTGPYQFLSRLPGARVTVASPAGGEVRSDRLTFSHTVPIAKVAACDLILVPGGPDVFEVALDEDFLLNLRSLAASARYIAAVCTGSLILGAAGLLTGRRAACHWAWRELLPEFGAIVDEARVVRDRNIFTGGGVTAGIDLALTILAEIAGKDVAQQIQLAFEYAPAPPFQAGRPELAPPQVVAGVQERIAGLVETRSAHARQAAARISERDWQPF